MTGQIVFQLRPGTRHVYPWDVTAIRRLLKQMAIGKRWKAEKEPLANTLPGSYFFRSCCVLHRLSNWNFAANWPHCFRGEMRPGNGRDVQTEPGCLGSSVAGGQTRRTLSQRALLQVRIFARRNRHHSPTITCWPRPSWKSQYALAIDRSTKVRLPPSFLKQIRSSNWQNNYTKQDIKGMFGKLHFFYLMVFNDN